MKKLFCSTLLLGTLLLSSSMPAQANDYGHEVLGKKDGWGAYGEGTTGGAAASSHHVYTVENRKQLVDALGGHNNQNGNNSTPKIIYIKGTIDLNVDDHNKSLSYDDYKDPAYNFDQYIKTYDPKKWGKKEPAGKLEEARSRSQKKQKERVIMNVGSNTTIIGLNHDAKIVGGGFHLKKAENVIIRNIEFQDAYDYFPAWDPTDGKKGNWNSEYDNLLIETSKHIWVDHCTFNDGNHPDEKAGTYFGREFQHHDGLLDIKKQSDFITVSYNVFSDHSKNTIIGSSDKYTADQGHLRVTFHHNMYSNIKERAPRVRFGMVHMYNNYFKSTKKSYNYSWGIGFSSKIYAESNYFDLPKGTKPDKIINVFKGNALYERDTLLNDQTGVAKIDVVNMYNRAHHASIKPSVGWKPVLYGNISPVEKVPEIVQKQAGAGKLK
ncbi:pectate lyase [Bacillus sp. WMMC1349]|uniref:pectate lyase family protein n=1 Tax=Bacillus sp. WMMC1349 TaxID=2736254 RepID=UPI00155369D3|nr:pectate lyase [Bacillus sp. WMMC1349]NPC92277.1 pectate lyase [Bacillus sp. WMMC1349]